MPYVTLTGNRIDACAAQYWPGEGRCCSTNYNGEVGVCGKFESRMAVRCKLCAGRERMQL